LKVLQSQFTLFQLSIQKDVVRNPLDQALDSRRRGIGEGARGGLYRIGQHDNPGFFGLGFGAGITEIVLIDRFHLRFSFSLAF